MKLLSRREIRETDAEIAFVGFVDESPREAGPQSGRNGEDQMKLELTHWRAWKPEDYTEGSAFDHIALVVGDVRGLVERLKAEGVKVAKEPYALSGSGSVIAFVHDLDGNWVELIQKAR